VEFLWFQGDDQLPRIDEGGPVMKKTQVIHEQRWWVDWLFLYGVILTSSLALSEARQT
jgi:hypothetical protein